MTEHKALSAFEQAALQEEVEALNLRVARLADAVSNYFSALEVTTKLHTDQDDWNLHNAARALDEALSPKADQRWLLDKQAEALESAAKWFDATEYYAREHGEITAYAENELRRMASELRRTT